MCFLAISLKGPRVFILVIVFLTLHAKCNMVSL